MAEPDPSGPLLEAPAGVAGPHATEPFALLGDETRLAILLALWEAYDPHADDNAVSFSELFRRVDYDNPGSFRYHLEQLEGQFLRQRAKREGYELRNPGLKLVQTVVAGTGIQDATLEATEIDQPCPLCGASTAVRYREGTLAQFCTDCDGAAPGRTNVDGFLNAVPFDPAGLADRTAEEIRAASRVARLRQTQAMFDGVCPTCSGPVDGWLESCPDHEPSETCEHCGTRFAAWARFQCRTCKDHSVSSPKALALFHPAVVSFYDDHGISTRFRAGDFERVCRGFDLVDAHELNVVSGDPPRAEVTVEREGDEIRLVFDETADVVDVHR